MRCKATIYFNQTRGSRFIAWEPDAQMIRSDFFVSHNVGVDDTDPNPTRLADEVYRQANYEIRINGHYERSMSVGDVVVLLHPNRTLDIFSCESTGWQRIRPEVWAYCQSVQTRQAG